MSGFGKGGCLGALVFLALSPILIPFYLLRFLLFGK